ncbi:MAG: hypothetical protein H6Q14_2298 [Bacteroidetes bacterium]|nr:hypothetical protein [Bacteroidota bacterium]
MNVLKKKISGWLSTQPSWVFVVYASLTAFLTYSCMYAFRKPFTVGLFEDLSFWGVDYKIWLITFQVVGYTLSKFIGIKYVSEMKPTFRAIYILVLVGMAELALLFFWIIPKPYNMLFMFFNGLPLGMIWGLVFSYLEGRRMTEILGASLSVSFIVASGVVKSVGEMVKLHWGASDFAMPFITGAIFAVPLVVCVFLLDCIPSPSAKDELLRTKRMPMNKHERMAFLKTFSSGIVLLVIAYVFLTVFRDMRDNFSIEIWRSLGYTNDPAIFTLAELPVAFFTLLALALVVFIRPNFKAFNVILLIVLSGFMLVVASTLCFQYHIIGGEWWMILIGTGLYLGYIPFNAFLYERLISSFRYVSNVGFLIYVSDAFGYLGSLGVVFYKNFFSPTLSWLQFFIQAGIYGSLMGFVLTVGSIFYFQNKMTKLKTKSGYDLP